MKKQTDGWSSCVFWLSTGGILLWRVTAVIRDLIMAQVLHAQSTPTGTPASSDLDSLWKIYPHGWLCGFNM